VTEFLDTAIQAGLIKGYFLHGIN